MTASVDAAASRLSAAVTQRQPCAPVRDVLAMDDLAGAYAVQQRMTDSRVAAGARIVGRKIGLTNPVVQRQLGVDQPDFGVLFDDMACDPAAPVDTNRLLQPRIEAEIAFVLDTDLVDVDTDDAAVRAATRHVVAALEIVDSRVAGWDIRLVDTVADNGSAGLFVLGSAPRELGDFDLRACTMTLHRGEELVSSGSGADCLGDPVTAVAWLARTAASFGAPLRAGDIVLSGALGPVVPVRPGDVFVASIDGVGDVRAEFTP